MTSFEEPGPSAKGYGRLRFVLVLSDLTGSFMAWLTVLAVTGQHFYAAGFSGVGFKAGLLSLLTVALMAFQRLYQARVCAVRAVELSGIARACVLCGIAAATLDRVDYYRPSITANCLGAVLAFATLSCLRVTYSHWIRSCRVRGYFCRPVCVFGTNEEARALVALLGSQPELGYRVLSVLGNPDQWRLQYSSVPAVSPGDAAATARNLGASGVLIASTAVEAGQLDCLVRDLLRAGLHVQISAGLSRVGHHRMRAAPLSHQPMFYVERPQLAVWQRRLKRMMDLLLASITLLVTAPVLAACTLAIRLDDKGPIFYRQERVGKNGTTFKVIKLRTMIRDASAQLADLAAMNERNGPLFKLTSDPRVTRVGRFLRATSLDELPQLWNVLRGDMSLVGPRPALPTEVEQFDSELFIERTSVPPGITGLWQVEARDNPSFHAYRRLDLFYVDNWSLTMDFAILASTVWVVLERGLRTLRGGGAVVQAEAPVLHTDLTAEGIAATNGR